jgi:hypothetical protein
MTDIYHTGQVKRLMDHILPADLLAHHQNPILNRLSQYAEFGWHSSLPNMPA